MTAKETPIRKCFSCPGKKGSFYHEFNESNKVQHTVHEYDEFGRFILNSTKDIELIEKRSDYFVSDRFGNKI